MVFNSQLLVDLLLVLCFSFFVVFGRLLLTSVVDGLVCCVLC